MSVIKFLSLEHWAALVLREIRAFRKEVRASLATIQEQMQQITDAQDATLQGLGVIGTDVANLVTEVTTLQQQIAAATAAGQQATVDLSPILTRAQAINDKLIGVRTAAEAGQVPTAPAPAEPPAV